MNTRDANFDKCRKLKSPRQMGRRMQIALLIFRFRLFGFYKYIYEFCQHLCFIKKPVNLIDLNIGSVFISQVFSRYGFI